MNQINPDLDDIQKNVLFNAATEVPFSGKYVDLDEVGEYRCANCSALLFNSDSKYKSTEPGLIGWPSFDKAVGKAIESKNDFKLGIKRKEAVCANCGGHLGHVFEAGDSPSGTHYCINSASLNFKNTDNKS